MMPNTKDRVIDMAGTARPYVDRALHDEELRDHMREAYGAARAIYDQLVQPRGVTGIAARVASDDEIQQNVRRTVEEIRMAATRLQQQKQSHNGRNLFLLLIGIVLGALFNPVTGPETRRWVKDRLFGSDDFGYNTNPGSDNGA
jgi:hypothetical protein